MDPGMPIDNWQQAFDGYRIPQTRAIEKQLQSNAAQNKGKLRTLVGDSYRELLATAQAIVVLDEQTRVTEDHISTISHNCRPPQLDASPKAPPADKVALAQFRLLQRCCTATVSCLRELNLLQGARLIVVSRLLLNSLSSLEITSKSLDSLRNKLTRLRRQLLLRVESRLNNPTSSLPNLLESICAYCLVTSSSAEDALAHVRQLRLEKIRRQLAASQQSKTLCEALRYQLSSLQTFKSLVGRPVVEAINSLQKKPILADPSIRDLESLDLDRILPLIPNDIRSFVPYFKRNASTPEELQLTLDDWSREVCRLLSSALRQCLSDMTQIDGVLDLRRQIYTILLPFYFSAQAGVYLREQIAQAIDQKVSVVCQDQGALLYQSTDLLLDKASGKQVQPLWDEVLALSSLDAGGDKITRQVRKRHAGHTATSSKALRTMERWVSATNTTLGQLDKMSKTRWRDILEEPDEDNEDVAAALIMTLTEGDPKLYREVLQSSLQAAVLKHETIIAEAASQMMNEKGDFSYAIALLRSIRLSISTLQHPFPENLEFERFQAVMPKLQQVIADGVAEQLSRTVRRGIKAAEWEKSILPENMPSPRAFATLRHLCKLMVEVGSTDLWSPSLVGMVKKAVSSRVFDPEYKVLYMDHEFDEAYICIALGQERSEAGQDGRKRKELAKLAFDYWIRTKLLLGVIA